MFIYIVQINHLTRPRAPRGPSKSCRPFRDPGGSHPHGPKAIAHRPRCPLGLWPPALQALFWGGPLQAPPLRRREAPRSDTKEDLVWELTIQVIFGHRRKQQK